MAYTRRRSTRRAPVRSGTARRAVRRTGRTYSRAPARRTASRGRARAGSGGRTIRLVIETQGMNSVQRPDLGLKAPPKPRQPAFK